jgi:hypothetical protein
MRNPKDPTTNIVVQQLDAAIKLIAACPLFSGAPATATLVLNSWIPVKHGLERAWTDYLITAVLNDTGAGSIYARHTPRDSKTLELMAKNFTANPQIRLWIY